MFNIQLTILVIIVLVTATGATKCFDFEMVQDTLTIRRPCEGTTCVLVVDDSMDRVYGSCSNEPRCDVTHGFKERLLNGTARGKNFSSSASVECCYGNLCNDSNKLDAFATLRRGVMWVLSMTLLCLVLLMGVCVLYLETFLNMRVVIKVVHIVRRRPVAAARPVVAARPVASARPVAAAAPLQLL